MLDWLVNHSGLSIQTVAYYGRHTAAVLVSRYSQPDMSQIYEVFGRREAPGRLASCKIVASIELEGE
jgi:hypothetical protein